MASLLPHNRWARSIEFYHLAWNITRSGELWRRITFVMSKVKGHFHPVFLLFCPRPNAYMHTPNHLFFLHVVHISTVLCARCIRESWGVGGGEPDKRQEFREKCRREVTPPVRGATQVHMSYTWNGPKSSSWNPSQGIKSHWGVTLCQTRRRPASLTLTPPTPPQMSLGCSQRSRGRCNVAVRGCQNRCRSDCWVLRLLWKAGRSVERRTPETWQVAVFFK